MKRVFAHIGFSMALTLIVLNMLKLDVAFIISIVLAVAVIASIMIPKLREKIAIPLCLGSALFACLVFMLGNYAIAPQMELNGKTANASFYYIDIPEVTDDGCSYIVKTVSIDDENAPQNIKLKIKTDEEINAKPYQIVNAKVKFNHSYNTYSKNIFMSATAEDVELTNSYVFSPWMWVYNLRLDIIKTLSNTLKGDVGNLSSALVTGYKKGISDKLYSAFKFSGVVHLIAVSGFHLTVLTFLLFLMLKLFKANNLTIAVVATLFIGVCIGLGGFSKSIIRASIMMLVVLWGNASKNRADVLNSLGIAVALICLNPFAVTDVGAQLSVLSTLALVSVSTRLKQYNFIIKTVIIPWVIILFTFPVMALSFGYVSIAGLVSNVFAGVVGSASLVVSIVCYVWLKIGWHTSLIVFVTKWLITRLIKIVTFFSSLRFAVVPLDNGIKYIAIGTFVMLSVALLVNKQNWKKVFSSLAFITVYASLFISVLLNLNTANVLVTQNGSIAVAYKDEGYAYGIDDKSDFYIAKTFLFANHIEIDDIENYQNLNNINAFELNGNCAVDVNGVTVAVSNERMVGADINVCNGSVYDSNGKINLKDGDVMYKIKADSSYEASWLN